MSGSSRSPLVRPQGGMWSFLGFVGVVWLAISWSMLRLEPTDAARVAGPVILFGAVSEALRALADARVAVLHTALAVLFTATGALLIIDGDSSLATPTALLGWYLLVRGAADVVLATMNRDTDRSWGLTVVLGVTQTGLGFYAASSLARNAGALVLILAGLALARAIADLAAAAELRDPPATQMERERAAGAAGYAAGLADYAAAATSRSERPRHRAPGLLAGRPVGDLADVGFPYPGEEAHPGDHGSDAMGQLDTATVLHTDSLEHTAHLGDGTDPTGRRADDTEGFPAIRYPVTAMASAAHPVATMFTGPQPSPVAAPQFHDPAARESAPHGSRIHESRIHESQVFESQVHESPLRQSAFRDEPVLHLREEPGASRHRVPAGPPAGMSLHGAPETPFPSGDPGRARSVPAGDERPGNEESENPQTRTRRFRGKGAGRRQSI